MGVVYWEGTWITVGRNSWEENHEKWEKFGSGWASSFASAYDPKDAGQYYGGCAVENQAMFDPDGKPLESLRIFNLVRYGNQVQPRVDEVKDVNLFAVVGEEFTLPETVDAIMTDGTTQQVAVEWEPWEGLYTAEAGKYEVNGTAEGLPVTAYLTVEEVNLLKNGDFESGEASPWVVTELGSADQLKMEKKASDSLSGQWHYHFWSAKSNSVDFTLEQTVAVEQTGTYRFAISIMGGDSGETDVYAFVKINGETVATAPMSITAYGSWDTGEIREIFAREGDEITAGIHVRCGGSGGGAWGKIDDGILNKEN
jgi:arabinogalactan endo-1,4-beta-galactosidase